MVRSLNQKVGRPHSSHNSLDFKCVWEYNHSMIELYLDMDGVLADFNKAYYADYPLGGSWNKVRFRTMVREHKIFEGLEMLPNAQAFLDSVESLRQNHKVSVKILSSKGTYDVDQGAETVRQKKQWLEKHGIMYPANFVRSQNEKAKFATPISILIDDSVGCINPFIEAGGIGILYTDEYYQETLKNLYLKIHELLDYE